MTTSPIKRRRTAQQILLRRACQTKGVIKSHDAVELSGRNWNGDKAGVRVLSSMARDFGLIQERSLSRTAGKVRRVPVASSFRISGERKTAGKLSGCDELPSPKKVKPNEGMRSPSGQRSGYTSRGSTKSQNSSTYPSKWPLTVSTEDAKISYSKASLNELKNCPPLNRTPYDHNLNTPLKSGDSSLCPPIKKKARRKNLKAAAAVVSGSQPPTKPLIKSRNHSPGDKSGQKRGSSQCSGVKLENRAYSGEEVRQGSKSNSEISIRSSKCKFHCPGVSFKNYGGYSPSETEFDTVTDNHTNRHCRSESFCKKIEKVSRPPTMCANTGAWNLELPSETEMEEFLGRVDEERCANGNQSSFSAESHERKLRIDRGPYQCCSNKMRRDGDRNRYVCRCNCTSKGNRSGCADDDRGCPCTRRNPEACISLSRHSVRFHNNEWSGTDYDCHESPREEIYYKKRPCDDYGYTHKPSNGCESRHGTGWPRRDPHRSRPPRPAYTMGAGRGSYGTGNYGRGACEMEYECKANEPISNRKCNEAITQTSKIIMTTRIDENSANCSANCLSSCSPNCSFNQAQDSLEENRYCPLSTSRNQTINVSQNRFKEPKCMNGNFGEKEMSAKLTAVELIKSNLSRQDKVKQNSKHMRVVESNSLILQSGQKATSSLRTNSIEVQLSSSCLPCNQELSAPCPPCQQEMPLSCQTPCQQQVPPLNLGCKRGLSPSHSSCPQGLPPSCPPRPQGLPPSCSSRPQGLPPSCSPRPQGLPPSCSPRPQGLPSPCSPRQEETANSYQQQSCRQYNETLLTQGTKECPSVTTSLCELHQEQAHAFKRTTRNPRKRVRKSSRCRDRSSSQRKDICGRRDDSGYQRRSQSFENCYHRRFDQGEDQCDVVRILSIIQQTVAGLQKEIKKGKGYESSRSSGNGCGSKWKTRALSEKKNTNLTPSSSPCQKKMSPTTLSCQKKLSSTSLSCHKKMSHTSHHQELSQPCPPCQQTLSSPCPTYPPECTPLSAPCQPELTPLSAPCQPELTPLSAPCQQEFSPLNAPCQQDVSPCNLPCQQDLYPKTAPCKQSIPPCQQRSSPSNPPCQQGWSICPHMECKHHPGCRYLNRYSHPNNGINYGLPMHANNPYKYGINPTNIYQDRKGPHLSYWSQLNQANLKLYGNATDIVRGCPRTEQNYPQMFPYNDPNYSAAFKNRRCNNDPEVKCIFPNKDWYGNNHRSNVCPGNHLPRPQCVDHRCGKCSLDPTQLGNQDPSNRCRVTFQKHISSRSSPMKPHQTEAGFQYANLQRYYGEIKTGNTNINHKSPHKGSQNADNLRKELFQYQGSLPPHEINKSCAQPVPRNKLEDELEVCENPNCSDRFPRNRQDTDSEICENASSSDRFQRNIQEIDSEICENPNCPGRCPRIDTEVCENPNCPFRNHRNRLQIDSEVCESTNTAYRFSKSIEIDSESCENANCPYRIHRNREAIDSLVCDNANCSYRIQRNREDINTEVCDHSNCPYRLLRNREAIDSLVCDNPNCPYKFPRNREAIDPVVCENPNAPYRSSRNRESIDSAVCESPNCPYKFPRNRNDDIDCENPNCPYKYKRNRTDIESEVCISPNCPYKLPRNRNDDIDSLICENPNCPYKYQRNRLEIDTEVCENSNSSDRLKIICNNPQCPGKLKRNSMPYPDVSDSLLEENPQTRCDEKSSMESFENHLRPINKNNMWLCGGFEPVASQLHYPQYKTEENRFIEFPRGLCNDDFPRRQRGVLFTDLTNQTTRQNSGKSERFDDDSIGTKSSIKIEYHRYLPLDKIPSNVASGMRPRNGMNGRRRLSPHLMKELNCYDKHILKTYEREKIEKVKIRESVRVIPTPGKHKSQTTRRDSNSCYSKKAPKRYSRQNDGKRKCYCPPKCYSPPTESSSTSELSDCSCPKKSPQRKLKCLTRCPTQSTSSEFSCCKPKVRARSQREKPEDIEKERLPRNNKRYTSKSSEFSCLKKKGSTSSEFSCCKPKERSRCQREKPENIGKQRRPRNDKRNKSTSSEYACLKKTSSPKRKEDCCKTCNTSKKERSKNVEKTTSKSSLFSCCKRKEKPPPQKRERNCGKTSNISDKERNKKVAKTTSKSSGISCCKKKEKPPPLKCVEKCSKNERYGKVQKENDLQGEKTKSKSCLKKKENPPSFQSNSKSCLKKKKHPPSFQCECYGEIGGRNFSKENNIQEEISKSSRFPCFKKEEKGFRKFGKENDLRSEKSKSKLSGLFSGRKKEAPDEICCKPETRSEKFKSKLSELFSCKKKENPEEICWKPERRSEKFKSKLSGLFSCKKKENPEKICWETERSKYDKYAYELPQKSDNKPSCVCNYQCCRRNDRENENNAIQNWEDTPEKQNKMKKFLKLPACCYKNRKTSERIKECPYSGSDDDDVTVLYDSSYRFNQESGSCIEITVNAYCYDPDKPGDKEMAACCPKSNKYRIYENGFYKIGQ